MASLQSGDLLLVKDSTTGEIVNVEVCTTEMSRDIYLSSIDRNGRIQLRTFGTVVSTLPSGSFIECVFFDWDHETSAHTMSSITRSLQNKSIRRMGFGEWMMSEESCIGPNDAMLCWWWQFRNKHLFLQMCFVCLVYQFRTNRFEWNKMHVDVFERWCQGLKKTPTIDTGVRKES